MTLSGAEQTNSTTFAGPFHHVMTFESIRTVPPSQLCYDMAQLGSITPVGA